MVDFLFIVLFIAAAASWVAAMLSAVALVSQRRADISLARLCFDGMRWFRRETFRPEAAQTWRVFIAAWLAFMACVILIALSTILRAA